MRTILADNPIFVASSKTLDFSAITGFNIKNLLAINNLTRKILIYAISTNGYAGSWNELNKTLTLDYDTTTFANDDLLVCYYDINSVSIDNFPLNQIVTVDGINLLATEVTNLDIKNLLNSLDNKDFATETTLSNINTKLTTIDNSVNSLLKPSNTLNKINTIDTITNTVTVDGSLNINNFPSNQTVNGTITANVGTTNGLALDSSISTVNNSLNNLLKPADTLNKVNTIDTITNTVTIQGDVNASISNLNTLATETTLVSVLQAIVNNRAFQETIWTDNNSGTLTFFLRRTIYNPLTDTLETENILPNGTPYTPTGIQSVTTANKDFELRNIEYKAINSDTGYTAGDFISRTDIMDLTSNPATVTSTIWFNVSTNTNLISIPNSNDILLLESLEAQETTQLLVKTNTDDIKTKIDTSNSLLNDIKSNTSSSISNYALETGGKLASLDTNIGAKSDTVASDDIGTFSLIAMIKKVAQNITTLKNIFTTTANGLKVDGSAVTQPVSGTMTANIGTTNGLALDSSLNTINSSINSLLKPADTLTKVTTVDNITNTVAVAQSDTTASGNITALNGAITLTNLNNKATCIIQITGSWTGTLRGQVSQDGTNWIQLTNSTTFTYLSDFSQSSTIPSSTNNCMLVNIAGFKNFRIIATSSITGTAVITMVASSAVYDNSKLQLGQTTMALSQPVAIASNQSNVPTIFNLTGSDSATKTLSNGAIAPITMKGSTFVSQSIFPSTASPIVGVSANYHCISVGYTIYPSSISATAGYRANLVLLESNNNGGAYRPIWYSDTITASNIATLGSTGIIVPMLPVRGIYRQWQLVTNSGITVSSSSFSVQQTESSRDEIVRYKFVDYTANLLNGILNATSSSYNISSATQINVRINCGTITGGVGAVYQIQVSDNNVDFCNVGTTFQAVASSLIHTQISGVVATYVRIICVTATTGTQTGNEITITAQE